ncbi:hypothetical protein [Parvularcula lutaonensis]|uniref:Cobalamin biosynthesis protein CbiG n=1 Tax=Parvularcula lutaonensis TaxID=491923 RepID=A0ABV7MA65_9PROT|nr:hypothetical protein [Parvularcula lutaonensis]GGY36387.1 hypothetical protein GCM10007148_00700 [Parvularcula lutaonensis]
MSRLFDCYIAVDWSAANAPARGKDSIWVAARWAEGGAEHTLCENIPTRSEASERISSLVGEGMAQGRRVFVGFDFAFGYPAGFAGRIGRKGWQDLWSGIAEAVEDDDRNRSNRFAVAGALNERLGEPVFWGKPHQHKDRYPSLPAKKPSHSMAEKRVVERLVPTAKSVFQMAYNGAVGSQSLLGIARLETLRRQVGAKVWPFETGFVEKLPSGPSAIFAEIYPSLVLSRAPRGEVKDAAQVKAVTAGLSRRDREGTLRPLLDAPPGVTEEERAAMLREEGSIIGAGVL